MANSSQSYTKKELVEIEETDKYGNVKLNKNGTKKRQSIFQKQKNTQFSLEVLVRILKTSQ